MYQVRPGSHAARAIEHLQQLGDGAALSTAELAAVLGLKDLAVGPCLKTARDHGLLVTDRRGRNLFWSVPSEVAPEENLEREPGPEEPPEFNAALWADGDLVIYGAQENEGGSFTLSREQVAMVKRLIAAAD